MSCAGKACKRQHRNRGCGGGRYVADAVASLELRVDKQTPWELTKDIDAMLKQVQEQFLEAVRSNPYAVTTYRIQITKEIT